MGGAPTKKRAGAWCGGGNMERTHEKRGGILGVGGQTRRGTREDFWVWSRVNRVLVRRRSTPLGNEYKMQYLLPRGVLLLEYKLLYTTLPCTYL